MDCPLLPLNNQDNERVVRDMNELLDAAPTGPRPSDVVDFEHWIGWIRRLDGFVVEDPYFVAICFSINDDRSEQVGRLLGYLCLLLRSIMASVKIHGTPDADSSAWTSGMRERTIELAELARTQLRGIVHVVTSPMGGDTTRCDESTTNGASASFSTLSETDAASSQTHSRNVNIRLTPEEILLRMPEGYREHLVSARDKIIRSSRDQGETPRVVTLKEMMDQVRLDLSSSAMFFRLTTTVREVIASIAQHQILRVEGADPSSEKVKTMVDRIVNDVMARLV